MYMCYYSRHIAYCDDVLQWNLLCFFRLLASCLTLYSTETCSRQVKLSHISDRHGYSVAGCAWVRHGSIKQIGSRLPRRWLVVDLYREEVRWEVGTTRLERKETIKSSSQISDCVAMFSRSRKKPSLRQRNQTHLLEPRFQWVERPCHNLAGQAPRSHSQPLA